MAPLLQTACSSFKKLARVCMLHSNNALRVYAAENARDSIKQKRGPRGIMGNLIYYYAGSNSVYGTGNLHISARPLAHIMHDRQPCPPSFRFHRKLVNVHMKAACEAIFARWCDLVIHCMQPRTNATPLYAVRTASQVDVRFYIVYTLT